MAARESVWQRLAPYLASCPSPHNTQPYRLRVIDDATAEVVFIARRGLPVGDPLGRFTWLTAGIFIEIATIAAHGMGYELSRRETDEPMYRGGDVETPQVVSTLTLTRAEGPIADMDPALILARQTSRLPYDGNPIPATLIEEMVAEAARGDHRFETRSDKSAIDWVIELNRQALFHDMENAGVRKELTHWLRFDRREEEITHDGLSARCMGFSERMLRTMFTHPTIFTSAPVKPIVGSIYKRSMTGVGTIGWLRGPYATQADWMAAGRTMIRLWLIVTRHGFYWHPYGSVITSDEARGNMIRYLEMDAETPTDFVWLLLRLGKSPDPPRSYRLPAEEIILCA